MNTPTVWTAVDTVVNCVMKNTQPYCIIAELMQLNTQTHL